VSHPKSKKPLRKSPGNSPPMMSFMTKSSKKPMKKTICKKPALGMASSAAKPFGMEENWVPAKSISPELITYLVRTHE
jgi:hypothetical protein